jgi:hypothetical protein
MHFTAANENEKAGLLISRMRKLIISFARP